MMINSKEEKQKYSDMVDSMAPKSPIFSNCIKAFISGGLICILGQFINNMAQNYGLNSDDASLVTSVVLIFISAVLTGFGLYGKLGKFCGAGTIVPITGFANSMVSPAIEFKKEGMVFGLGAKMFIIAGPVIIYGVLSSIVVGFIYYLLG
ncbi:MAG: stage V sporulation protein AC [Tyzzerella sp.]|uniref:Stage V sporulation protein AC n=1 Tax=Candidatus Fimicola merdigallinarum TaxID=2840819 RepID=A0A9D9DYF0_9FIRM|nr:stage V sporulation protein AC [Candidatus Fimicola merdigallinarum]